MRNIQKQFGYRKCVFCMENSGKAFKSLFCCRWACWTICVVHFFAAVSSHYVKKGYICMMIRLWRSLHRPENEHTNVSEFIYFIRSILRSIFTPLCWPLLRLLLRRIFFSSSHFTFSLPQHCVERCSQWVSGYMDSVVEFPHIQFSCSSRKLFTHTSSHSSSMRVGKSMLNFSWKCSRFPYNKVTRTAHGPTTMFVRNNFLNSSHSRSLGCVHRNFSSDWILLPSHLLRYMCPRPSTRLPQSCTHWHSIVGRELREKFRFSASACCVLT